MLSLDWIKILRLQGREKGKEKEWITSVTREVWPALLKQEPTRTTKSVDNLRIQFTTQLAVPSAIVLYPLWVTK